jgi:WD40 repeat protein
MNNSHNQTEPNKHILNKFFQDLTNKIYTDIEIILVDNHNTISIHAHRSILDFSSDYFHNLFKFGKEKNQSSISINVCNAKIAHDLILSFYDQKINPSSCSAKYLLEMFTYRSFFGLDNNVELLYDIKVTAEEFDLFMQVVEEFDLVNNKRLLKAIKKNIPLEYDLNNFTLEFIDELQSNDNLIVSGGEDCCIKIWDANTGQLLNTLNKHPIPVYSVAFSPDNSKVVSGYEDGSIKIWDVYSGELLCTLCDDACQISCVVFSLDGLKIVSSEWDNKIKIWDAITYQLLNILEDTEWVSTVAFSLDSLKIVSGNNYGSIKLWDVQTGLILNTLIDPNLSISNSYLYSVAFSPDNSKIISGGDDHNIKIWNAYTG